MKQTKDNDLPVGVEHISTVVPQVNRFLALRQFKQAFLELHSRGLISEKAVQKAFEHFLRIKECEMNTEQIAHAPG